MIKCTFENGNSANLRHCVVDCLLIKDGEILLGKRANGLLEANKWGLLGGYIERDETIFEAARREILEESGWTVGNLRLMRIIDSPNRPHEDRQNIAFVIIAEAGEKVSGHDSETKELQWFPINETPNNTEIAFDHADNIMLYRNYLKSSFPLPVITG